ncbi:RPA-interacting protein B-like [Ceratina calcarata]|uniref:RPA-interacting protein B-like n=1 Tax=Ceratina calcarata TaxID=156304 RepID=A0AAJ7NB67_9HYME|nr:RPA-interacting protein B-like [Ceratina calcarata]
MNAMEVTSPTLSAKMKNRENANKIRHGSPKLQEVLRERCRIRMRERRSEFLNRRRFSRMSISSDTDVLGDIVRAELNYIADTSLDPAVNPFVSSEIVQLDPEEAVVLESEIIQEEAQWIVQEYEKMMNEELEFALAADEQIDEVICPICQKCNLVQKENRIDCKSCNFMLNCSISLRELKSLINNHVDNHSVQCTETPGFLSIPESNTSSLLIICDKCSTLSPIA